MILQVVLCKNGATVLGGMGYGSNGVLEGLGLLSPAFFQTQ